MRDIFLLVFTLAGAGVSLFYPFAGVLLWTWFSLMSPQSETYGFAQSLPLNLIVAACAVIGLFLSREKKAPPNDALLWLCFGFLLWCTLNVLVAVNPDWSWLYWDRTWKIFVLGLVVAIETRTRARIQALLWVIVISLFYYGVKGGIFTALTGGGAHVYGPQGTIIGDNNQLALALLMTLPLANYLRSQSANRWLGRLLIIAMAFTVVALTQQNGLFAGGRRQRHSRAAADARHVLQPPGHHQRLCKRFLLSGPGHGMACGL
jgi:probable O-glycosylation ligase (exosortase A-associated)